jgi:hypothetical protein
MENIDVVKILGYGITGLSFLLAFMAYSLLLKEQKKQEPNENFLKSISNFMKFCVILAILGLTSEMVLTFMGKDKSQINDDGSEQYSLSYTLKISDTVIELNNNVYFSDIISLIEISKSNYSKVCLVANSKNVHINSNIMFSWILFDSAGNNLKSNSFASSPQYTDSNFWSCKYEFTTYPIGQYKFEVDIAGNKKEIHFKLVD